MTEYLQHAFSYGDENGIIGINTIYIKRVSFLLYQYLEKKYLFGF